jgi:TRAP-type C4-dicarboxylate transport system permease small subunit
MNQETGFLKVKNLLTDRVRLRVGVIIKSIFYICILLVLVYMYHYNHMSDTTFIYNEF